LQNEGGPPWERRAGALEWVKIGVTAMRNKISKLDQDAIFRVVKAALRNLEFEATIVDRRETVAGCIDWLRHALSNGPQPKTTLRAWAAEDGFPWHMVCKASKRLGVEKFVTRGHPRELWQLPKWRAAR
jgi:hypothetical protein